MNFPIDKNVLNNKVMNGKTLLFLFSPRKMYDSEIHPFRYNFGFESLNFIDSVAKKDPSLLLNPAVSDQMLNKFGVVIPSPKGIEVQTSLFSKYWTFCLVLRNRVDLITTFPTEKIITGICSEEPVNLMTVNNTKPTVNPACRLIPFNELDFTFVSQQGLKGNEVKPNVRHLVGTSDIVRQVKDFVNEEALYISTPGTVANNTIYDHADSVLSSNGKSNQYGINNSDVIFCPDIDDNLVSKNQSVMNPILYSPKKHVQSIMNAVSNSVINNDSLIQPLNTKEDIQDNICSDLTIMEGSHNVNDSTFSYIFLGEFCRTIDPDIVIIQSQIRNQMSVIPPAIISPVTLFSSLLGEVIPLYMVKYNISGVAFGYVSYGDNFQILGELETFTEEDRSNLRSKIQRFYLDLKSSVFEMMKNVAGDFNLQVHVNLTGETIIDLKFFDYSDLNGYYSHSNLLKGYTAPIISNFDTAQSNSTELSRFIDNVSTIYGCI